MSEVPFVVGGADLGLRERLDEEISAFNAAATGYHDGRMLSVAVHGDGGDLRRKCGRAPGYPHGHDDVHLVKQFG
jgi:hypothetical protein